MLLRIGYDLDETAGIPDIEESNASVVASTLHPSGHSDLRTDVGL
jgi:hypothetical protein